MSNHAHNTITTQKDLVVALYSIGEGFISWDVELSIEKRLYVKHRKIFALKYSITNFFVLCMFIDIITLLRVIYIFVKRSRRYNDILGTLKVCSIPSEVDLECTVHILGYYPSNLKQVKLIITERM